MQQISQYFCTKVFSLSFSWHGKFHRFLRSKIFNLCMYNSSWIRSLSLTRCLMRCWLSAKVLKSKAMSKYRVKKHTAMFYTDIPIWSRWSKILSNVKIQHLHVHQLNFLVIWSFFSVGLKVWFLFSKQHVYKSKLTHITCLQKKPYECNIHN